MKKRCGTRGEAAALISKSMPLLPPLSARSNCNTDAQTQATETTRTQHTKQTRKNESHGEWWSLVSIMQLNSLKSFSYNNDGVVLQIIISLNVFIGFCVTRKIPFPKGKLDDYTQCGVLTCHECKNNNQQSRHRLLPGHAACQHLAFEKKRTWPELQLSNLMSSDRCQLPLSCAWRGRMADSCLPLVSPN